METPLEMTILAALEALDGNNLYGYFRKRRKIRCIFAIPFIIVFTGKIRKGKTGSKQTAYFLPFGGV